MIRPLLVLILITISAHAFDLEERFTASGTARKKTVAESLMYGNAAQHCTPLVAIRIGEIRIIGFLGHFQAAADFKCQ